MTAQDHGLRSRFGAALKKHLQAVGTPYRFLPIETGSVASGVPDCILELDGKTCWIEMKSYGLIKPMTLEKAMKLLSPAQKGFLSHSRILGINHCVLVERRHESESDYRYMIFGSDLISERHETLFEVVMDITERLR